MFFMIGEEYNAFNDYNFNNVWMKISKQWDKKSWSINSLLSDVYKKINCIIYNCIIAKFVKVQSDITRWNIDENCKYLLDLYWYSSQLLSDFNY